MLWERFRVFVAFGPLNTNLLERLILWFQRR